MCPGLRRLLAGQVANQQLQPAAGAAAAARPQRPAVKEQIFLLQAAHRCQLTNKHLLYCSVFISK